MTKTRTVLTYGTFDLFHVGHLKLLERLRAYGTNLIVGVSTDEFNKKKGKQTIVPYEDRASIVSSLKFVDFVIPEDSWDQKKTDIYKHGVDVLGMGDDWTGRFDSLSEFCEVIYLPRTDGISSSSLKTILKILDKSHVSDLKKALDLISAIVERFD